jgi:hypothetical protein
LLTAPGLPSSRPGGPTRPWSHQERGLRLAAQQPDLVVDPKTTAVPPGAPRAFALGEAGDSAEIDVAFLKRVMSGE